MGRKHCWKRITCWFPAFPPFTPQCFQKSSCFKVAKIQGCVVKAQTSQCAGMPHKHFSLWGLYICYFCCSGQHHSIKIGPKLTEIRVIIIVVAVCFWVLYKLKSIVSETSFLPLTFSHTIPGLTCLQYKSFENTVGRKGEIAHNEQFLLFPLCVLPVWRTFCYFHRIRNCRLQTL